uniref:Uncharacterized protein n=1 Tax=Acrobeloides nanus TaxID=290746 RepID=A0A914DGW3_9BILA
MYKRRLQQNLKRHIAVYSKTPDTHRSAVRIELPPIDQIPVTEMYVERLQFPYPQTPPPGYEEIPLDDQQATTPYNKKSLKKNRVTFMPDPPSYSSTQQDI